MHSIVLLPRVAICLETIDVCVWHMFGFSVYCIDCGGLWECLLCSGRFYYEARGCRCSCM